MEYQIYQIGNIIETKQRKEYMTDEIGANDSGFNPTHTIDAIEEDKRRHKHIYLIRHAESQNNVAKRDAKQAWRRFKRLQGLPTCQEWYSIFTLLSIPMNTDLSEDGEHMVTALRDSLHRDDFLQQQGIELIVHSHLIRAKRTCWGIFSSTSNPTIIEHNAIFEKNISEHFHAITGVHVSQRTNAFRQWLLDRKEKHIIVVGHSAFFRDMIQTECKMDNCEVRRVLLDTDHGNFHSAETLVKGGKGLVSSI